MDVCTQGTLGKRGFTGSPGGKGRPGPAGATGEKGVKGIEGPKVRGCVMQYTIPLEISHSSYKVVLSDLIFSFIFDEGIAWQPRKEGRQGS